MTEAVGGPGAGLVALLTRIAADASALAAMPLDAVDGATAQAARSALRGVLDRLGLVSAALLARVEADGRWAASGGARDVPQWAARRDGVSYGAARREVTLGRAIEPAGPLAATRAAVVAGQITLEHAQVLAEVGSTSDARRAALASDLADRNEAFLLESARRLPVDDFRRVTRRWGATIDDEAAEREHRGAAAREHLTLARRRDGLALSGFLTHEHGELLSTALRAVGGVPAKDDERGTDQRMAAALTDAARLVLERGLAGEGALVRPHLDVHVSYETLERLTSEAAEREAAARQGAAASAGAGADPAARVGSGAGPARGFRSGLEPRLVAPAELGSGVPLAPSVLERLVCDSEVSRVVFGPAGEVLDVGRAQRSFSKQLRRAVVARDRTCAYPGCSAHPNLCEVHHVRWWSRGGDTSVENGVLLCWYHHDLVHQRGLRITWRPFGWEFRRADGSLLVDEARRADSSPLGDETRRLDGSLLVDETRRADGSPLGDESRHTEIAEVPGVPLSPDRPPGPGRSTRSASPDRGRSGDPPDGPDLLDLASA